MNSKTKYSKMEKEKLKTAGSRAFKFNKGDLWDGDDLIWTAKLEDDEKNRDTPHELEDLE